MTKKELAAKIAKAQNLSESKLMKMTLGELEDMDRAFSDEDGGDLLGADAPSELPKDNTNDDSGSTPESDEGDQSPEASDVSDAAPESEPVEGKVIGYHPVTGKPVVE